MDVYIPRVELARGIFLSEALHFLSLSLSCVRINLKQIMQIGF
jgi:hypothetical protein